MELEREYHYIYIYITHIISLHGMCQTQHPERKVDGLYHPFLVIWGSISPADVEGEHHGLRRCGSATEVLHGASAVNHGNLGKKCELIGDLMAVFSVWLKPTIIAGVCLMAVFSINHFYLE